MRLLPVKLSFGRRVTLGYFLAAAISLLGLAAVAAIQPYVPRVLPARVYVPVHTVLEFASIVVSFAVFVVGWYGYQQTRNRQDLFIASAFLAVGAIDFVHALSYKGMPDFLGANTVGKAAAYWLAARFVAAAALLSAAFISPSGGARWIRPRLVLPVAVVLCAGLIGGITIYGRPVSALMFDARGLTPLKNSLEWLVVALQAAAFYAFGRPGWWQSDSIRRLRIALIVGTASEICFTLYYSPYDPYNVLGHIYKLGTYYLVLQALFVSSLRRPYLELSHTKEQLQKSFSRIGEALASGLRKDSTLTLIASFARQMFEADMAAISEIRPGDIVEVGTFDGLDPGVFRVPLPESLAAETFISGRPLLIDDIRTHPRARPEFLKLGLRSFMSAPVIREGRPAGAVYVASLERARFTTQEAEVLTAFARHAAIAIANAEHYEREHHIADALQEVIFPPPTMKLGEYELAGRYQPAWEEARVGGDFYDYFDLGDGRIGIAIGDVSGKGLAAAVHTAIVKYSYQAYLREGVSPAQALQRIGEAFQERARRDGSQEGVFITLFSAVLDSRTGRLLYCNAGHELPIKLSGDGETTMLDSTAPVLGFDLAVPFEESETTIGPGDALVLYTDGITEARVGDDLFGSDSLVAAVRTCSQCSPEQIAGRVYEQAREHARGVVQDDVALIVVRRAATSEP